MAIINETVERCKHTWVVVESKIVVEKKFVESIKVLILDGGGEFDSHEFIEFSKNHGIQHRFTTRYTPQHNGVVENKKHTIMNMAQNMNSYKKLYDY